MSFITVIIPMNGLKYMGNWSYFTLLTTGASSARVFFLLKVSLFNVRPPEVSELFRDMPPKPLGQKWRITHLQFTQVVCIGSSIFQTNIQNQIG